MPQLHTPDSVAARQAAYLAGRLARLRNDRRLVVFAAAQAQHAADYIVNRSHFA